MKKCMQIFIFLKWKHFVPDQMSLPHAAIFGPTRQNMDADIIWHGGTEYAHSVR